MTNPELLDLLRKLQRRLERALKQDLGTATEYVDRALDQVNYALEDVGADEEDFQRSLR